LEYCVCVKLLDLRIFCSFLVTHVLGSVSRFYKQSCCWNILHAAQQQWWIDAIILISIWCRYDIQKYRNIDTILIAM